MECVGIFTLVYSILLIFNCRYVSSLTIWQKPRPVLGYESYLDVIPVKFLVPLGLSNMNFSFQAGRNHAGCAKKKLIILIQHGGLPLVMQTNSSFPEGFVVTEPTIMFSMEVDDLAGISIVRPPPGPWFVISFSEGIEQHIKQKGLDSGQKCAYSLLSRLDLGHSFESSSVVIGEPYDIDIGSRGKYFSFKIPVTTAGFSFEVHKCEPSPCDLELIYHPFTPTEEDKVACHGDSCVLSVSSPPLDDVQFVQVKYLQGPDGRESQKVSFSVKLRECSPELVKRETDCILFTPLDRIQSMTMFFVTFGYAHKTGFNFSVNLMLAPVIYIPFEILDPSDIGGTLRWRFKLTNPEKIDKVMVIHVCGALLYNYLLDYKPKKDLCSIKESVNKFYHKNDHMEMEMFVPFPRARIWHVALQTTCYYKNNDSKLVCPQAQQQMDMSLDIKPCLNDNCRDKGQCMYSQTPDLVSLSACKCDAKYQGYACTDDTHAQTTVVQMAGAYLLTLSNLFFIPAIVIGIRRRLWVEAFIYFYTMFFSTFYHACDGMRLQSYRLCIIKYDVLQAADFFGSACSLWITLIAMASFRHSHLHSLLQIVGPFGIFIGIVYERTSLCVIAVPVLGGLLTITISWSRKMYKRKRLYPSWKRYVYFIVPGALLAASGAALFAFLETRDNYKYVHSVWHMSVALSICLLLPPFRPEETKTEAVLSIRSQGSQSTQPSDETSTSVELYDQAADSALHSQAAKSALYSQTSDIASYSQAGHSQATDSALYSQTSDIASYSQGGHSQATDSALYSQTSDIASYSQVGHRQAETTAETAH